MSTAAFKIQRLEIEGFKAFAAPQSFDIGGHVFVFGMNGLGKSSLVEAVRWCLFGLADRPAAEVRNVFYSAGDCRVAMTLDGPGGQWKIQRHLRPGSSGQSVPNIRDPNGNTVPQSKVFPHLARLGPREGTHIIFASQQSTRRRPQADITDFDKVLYSYLQIEDVPELLRRLKQEYEEQTEIGRKLANELENAEESLRSKLDSLNGRIEEILVAAPWPPGNVPTNNETDKRIRAFVKECGGNLEPSDGRPVTRDWLLKEAARAIQDLSVTTQQPLQKKLTAAKASLQEIAIAKQTFETYSEQLMAAQNELDSCERNLNSLLGTTTREHLHNERDKLVRRNKQLADYLTLAQQAARYIDAFSPEECPVCEASVSRANVLSRLKSQMESGLGQAGIAEALTDVMANLVTVDGAEAALAEAKRTFRSVKSEAATARMDLNKLLDDPTDPASTERTMERFAKRVRQLDLEVNESGSLVATKQNSLKNLKAEARFQEYRLQQEQLRQNLESGLQPSRDALSEFTDVLEAMRTVREALQESFNNTLNRTLPPISDLMTNVYGRLTQQASFPKIVVEAGPDDAARTLSIRVASERTPGKTFDHSEVLNGQAINALNLVPYFVFSQFQAEALELDCLLIDDPSQSFDTSRVELLMRELAVAATHAQLIVASHERDRFEPIIDRYFAHGSYRILRVTSFAPELGPTFERVD